MDKRVLESEISHQFVDAMASAAFGVSIVTTAGITGRFGLTVSAISSVSAEPPTLLVCVNRKNPIEKAISGNRRFVVNLLAESQMDLAKIFAGRSSQGKLPYSFNAQFWDEGENGLPVLKSAAANFICDLDSFTDVGTHRIFIGRVLVSRKNPTLPLVYSHRKFGKFLAF